MEKIKSDKSESNERVTNLKSSIQGLHVCKHTLDKIVREWLKFLLF